MFNALLDIACLSLIGKLYDCAAHNLFLAVKENSENMDKKSGK